MEKKDGIPEFQRIFPSGSPLAHGLSRNFSFPAGKSRSLGSQSLFSQPGLLRKSRKSHEPPQGNPKCLGMNSSSQNTKIPGFFQEFQRPVGGATAWFSHWNTALTRQHHSTNQGSAFFDWHVARPIRKQKAAVAGPHLNLGSGFMTPLDSGLGRGMGSRKFPENPKEFHITPWVRRDARVEGRG